MSIKHRIAKLAVWLNQNTGYMLVAIIIFFGISILGFQQDNKELLEDTKNISKDTQTIVSKQDETLKAIQSLALDNKISGEQLKEILLCMLIVPPTERTTDVQANCRQRANTQVYSGQTAPAQTETPSTPTVEGPSQTPTPAPAPIEAEQPSLLFRTLDGVTNLLKGVL